MAAFCVNKMVRGKPQASMKKEPEILSQRRARLSLEFRSCARADWEIWSYVSRDLSNLEKDHVIAHFIRDKLFLYWISVSLMILMLEFARPLYFSLCSIILS